MKLLNKTLESQITETTYTIQHPTEGVLIYKEWVDDRKKIIDSTLTSKHGYTIDDHDIMKQVWDFIDNLGE